MAIADDKSAAIFRTIAQSNGINTEALKGETKLTRKQYYSRLSRMKQIGLVRKKGDKYTLTTLGRIVYHSQTLIDTALANIWKLKAIDSLVDASSGGGLTTEERQKMIDALIEDQRLRDFFRRIQQ